MARGNLATRRGGKCRGWGRRLQYLVETRAFHRLLECMVGEAEDRLGPIFRRAVEGEIGLDAGRALGIDSHITIAEVVTQNDLRDLLLRRRDGGEEPAAAQPARGAVSATAAQRQ